MNYKQSELGDLLGVSNKAVSRWENGESFPDVGEKMKNSIICATRRKNKVLDQLNLKNSNLKKLLPNDDIFQVQDNYKIVDIDPENDVLYRGKDSPIIHISHYERKIASAEANIQSASNRLDNLKDSIAKTENEISGRDKFC